MININIDGHSISGSEEDVMMVVRSILEDEKGHVIRKSKWAKPYDGNGYWDRFGGTTTIKTEEPISPLVRDLWPFTQTGSSSVSSKDSPVDISVGDPFGTVLDGNSICDQMPDGCVVIYYGLVGL